MRFQEVDRLKGRLITRNFLRPRCLCVGAFLVAAYAGTAIGQSGSRQVSIGVSGPVSGTLTYQSGYAIYPCPIGTGAPPPMGQVDTFSYSAFVFTAQGINQSFSQSDSYTSTPGGNYGCPKTSGWSQGSNILTLVGSGYTVTVTLSENGQTATATTTPQGFQGILYPKYVVVGVTYAPPGDGAGAVSTVQYSGTTAVGTTTTKGSSFSNDVGFSVSYQNGVGTPGGATLAGGSISLTATESTDYTQTSNDSSTLTLNKSTETSYTTNGYPTNFATTTGAAPNINPSSIPASATINPNDWDVIQVWLNAEQLFTAFPANGTNPVVFQLNGFAYDPTDMAGPDVYPIQVGCLNGDFTAAYCATQQGVLNRSWVTAEMSPSTGDQITAPGCPQTAESPSICPNTQDAYNILAADPLAYNPGASPYTLLNSYPLPTTTSDGRFSQFGYPPNPIDYEPGGSETYTVTQMNTTQNQQGGSTQENEKVSVSEKVSAGFLGLAKSSITFVESDTMNWNHTWLKSLTTTQTVQNAFTIKGSNPPNYVPGEFVVYQDNTYGTFMFYPSN